MIHCRKSALNNKLKDISPNTKLWIFAKEPKLLEEASIAELEKALEDKKFYEANIILKKAEDELDKLGYSLKGSFYPTKLKVI
jgi:hypothetical protein